MIEKYVLLVLFIVISTIGGLYSCYKFRSEKIIYTDQKNYQTCNHFPSCYSDGVNVV